MRIPSRRTKVFGLLTVSFLLIVFYCEWREGCGPHWLRVVHAAQDVGGTFQLNPCEMWMTMPLLDKVAAIGLFGSGTAFFGSLALDVAAWFRARKRARSLL